VIISEAICSAEEKEYAVLKNDVDTGSE